MKSLMKAFLLGSAMTISAGAYAVPYIEVGDAGETLTTAQAIGADVDAIYGSYTFDSADLYSFDWAGGAFSVDTFDSTIDTELFLFNSIGQGVWASDGTLCCGVIASQIVDPALAAGHYYLGVGPYDYQPYSITDRLFNMGGLGQFAPQNNLVLDHWDLYHHTSGGDYIIKFRAPMGIPEPSTLALFSFLLLIAMVRSRARKGSFKSQLD